MPAGPCRKSVIAIGPFIAVVGGDLMTGVEVVVDFGVDLPAIRIIVGAGSNCRSSAAVGATHPLMHRGVQTIAAIKDVGMRHPVEILLAHADGIESRA